MCGVSGYVPQTADAALILGTVSGFSQPHCIDSCRDNPSCRAISFESELTKCTIYSKAIQFLDVTSTTESSLKFYDEVCGEKIASTSTFTVTVTTTPPTATSESPTVSCKFRSHKLPPSTNGWYARSHLTNYLMFRRNRLPSL